MGYTVVPTSGYRGAEGIGLFLPSLERWSDIPVLYVHGGQAKWNQFVEAGPGYVPAEAADRGLVGMSADFGTIDTWGNDDMLDAIDDLVTWANTNHGTRTDKVAIVGLSHGASALNWAWRNPTKVAAFAALLPGVNFAQLYARNPLGTVVSSMNTAYGDAAGVTAALPTRDPCAAGPVAAQRQIASKIAVWYGLDDTVTLPAEVVGWADAIGTPARNRFPMAGVGHDFDWDWDPVVDWLFNQVYTTP